MRPFGYPLTILNTLDSLGKFDGKPDEGCLLGYSTTSKAFRVYNKRTKRVEENMHIDFLEDQPNVAGSNPDWMFDLDFLTNTMNYILVSVENQVNVDVAAQEKPFENFPKDNDVQDLEDVAEKEEQHMLTEANQALQDGLERMIAQEIAAKTMDDCHLLVLPIHHCGAYDDEDVGVEAGFNNMDNTIDVSPIPTLRVHKDHPKGQILGDPKSAVQTRGKIQKASSVQQALNPRRYHKLLRMKVRLKQCKRIALVQITEVRLVAQGFRQEESIDYDEVFAPVAKIEAIRLFLAFASFMGFPDYQMDVKSCFLYGTYKRRLYVHQTPALLNLAHPQSLLRKGLKFSGKITPLFPNMLTHATGGEGSGEPTEPQPIPSPTQPSTGDQPPETSSSHATTQDSRYSLKGTNGNEGDQVQTPHDSPLSGGHTSDRAEGVLNLQELSVLCTNLSNRVLALESIKDAQAAEISALKSRIKKLEKKCKPSISHHRAWLKSVNRLSMTKRFRKKESVSKQERKKSKPESTLDDSTVFDDQDADHGMEYMETEEAVDEGRQSGETKEVKLTDDTEVVEDKSSGDKGGNAEELVSTARPDIDVARQEDSAVEPRTPPTTTSIFDDEDITMAQTLIKMKEEKAKEKGVSTKDEKGVSIKDVDDSSRPARYILTLKPLPTIDPKDKGKGVLKESPELAEMERERKERQRQDQAFVDYIASLYDEVQAKMDASEELAARIQMKERERCKYRHNQLNKKTFEEIQALYIKEQERDAEFVPIGSKRDEKMIDKMNKKATGMDEEEVPE
ncbi:retrovirus-related pol polyprotein from transposon TNT 1-94, partial [Tanacetum coccineum]